MGVDVKLVEGVGPVIDPPVAPTSGAARPRSGRESRRSCDAIRIVRDELARRPSGRRLLRRPVHRRRLPDRRQAVARLRKDEGADVPRARRPGTRCSTSSPTLRALRPRADARRRRRDPALRLVGRRALAGRLRRVRRAVLARILDAVDVPTIHFGTGTATLLSHGDAATWSGSTGGSRSTRAGSWSASARVQGNLDPAALLGAVGAARRRCARRARARARPNGHIFNLGHGILPQTDADQVTRLTELVQAHTVEARV